MTSARLTQRATTIRIVVDAVHPHDELVMVAENLGAIPPNTSLMIITTSTSATRFLFLLTNRKMQKWFLI